VSVVVITVDICIYKVVRYLKRIVRNGAWMVQSISGGVRFEVFTAVTMKNGVFWDVTPCGSCKNLRFGGT
jgi:hypothetical protein